MRKGRKTGPEVAVTDPVMIGLLAAINGQKETELCRAAGIGAQQISHIRRGHLPNLRTLNKLGKALGLRLIWVKAK